jgi:hypothetical protein
MRDRETETASLWSGILQKAGIVGIIAAAALPAGRASAEVKPSSPLSVVVEHPVDVYVGAYLIRIPSLSFRDNQFTVDGYIWFRWKGHLDPSPAETVEFCNGTIDKKEITDAKKIHVKEGDTEEEYEYACVRIQGPITKFWDVARYPFDKHILSLAIEDRNRESKSLRYVIDDEPSRIDENCQLPGWILEQPRANSVIHTYPTNYGDLDAIRSHECRFSRFVLDVPMRRASGIYFLKVLNGLYISVLIAFLTFFIKPGNLEARFGTGVGAVFAAIASQYVIAAGLPENNQLTLVDKLHVVATTAILLSMVESAASLYLFESDRAQLSRKLDRAALVLLSIGYVATNAWLMN